jgi:hypothetical protein
MRVAKARILALAARHGRIAFVYLRNGQPRDWALSCKAAKSAKAAGSKTGVWIAKFDPDVVIIEDPTTAKRKGRNARALLRAMLRVSSKSPAMVAKAKRVQNFRNKFDEAQAWIETFPQLADKAPRKRRLWDPEPRNLVFFEALALAQSTGFLPSDLSNLALRESQNT